MDTHYFSRKKNSNTRRWLILTIVVFFLILLVFNLLRLLPESSPAARGGEMDGIYGCLGCHGQDNYISPNEWTLTCVNSQSSNTGHPQYNASCNDLLAFFAVVRLGKSFPERIKTASPNNLLMGEKLARQFYCFQCHGELGQGGFPNAGSLKGYVPGYFGNDFLELTDNASPDTVKTWITESTNHELLSRPIDGPIAEYFLKRQAIQMPKFNSLSESELKLLVDYVITLNVMGPMDVKTLRRYDKLTRRPKSL